LSEYLGSGYRRIGSAWDDVTLGVKPFCRHRTATKCTKRGIKAQKAGLCVAAQSGQSLEKMIGAPAFDEARRYWQGLIRKR
jgi:hypothetical protein